MIKRLSAVGNSAALILDKPILELLNITMDTDLEITLNDDKNLVIVPLTKEQHNARIQEAHARVVARHDKTFRKLSQKPGK